MNGNSRKLTTLLAVGGLIGFAVLVATDHSIHLLRAVPFVFLLACPLLHVFHGGHGGHGAKHGNAVRSSSHDHGMKAERRAG